MKIQGNADCKREDEARRDEIAERCRRIWATDYSEAGFCREYNYRGMEQTDEFYKRPDSSAICSSADTSSGHEETDMDDFLVFE